MVGFVGSNLVFAGRSDVYRKVRSARYSRPCTVSATASSGETRRDFLLRGLAVAAVAVGASPAHADRTGKFSTKLTAARRYLPRIATFRDNLKELKTAVDSNKYAAVLEFTKKDGPADDVKNPLELFASSFFAESNKVSASSTLKPTIDSLLATFKAMEKSAKKKDSEGLKKAYAESVYYLNEYIEAVRSVKALGNDLDLLTFD